VTIFIIIIIIIIIIPVHKVWFERPEETQTAILWQSSRWGQPVQKTMPSAEKII
jgi:hypothetical protein